MKLLLLALSLCIFPVNASTEINEKSDYQKIKLIRPLMKYSKEDLVFISKKVFNTFVEDPSNENENFKRVKIRNLIKSFKSEGLNVEKFNLTISIIEEKNRILDTGGGVLNAIKHFSNENFIIINPDTIWNLHHLKELKLMEKVFFENKKSKCLILVAKKEKSFDQTLKGDFNLKNNLITRNDKENLKYIYTGLQIIKSEVFSDLNSDVFSINKIWDKLIENKELYGVESNFDFFHVSTLDIYKSLLKKLNIK